MKRVAHIPVC